MSPLETNPSDFWVVVETSDHGDPTIATCRTKAEAEAWAEAYGADPRYFGDPEVRPGWFTSGYPDGLSPHRNAEPESA